LDGIAEVVAAVKEIPVIGNGDVRTPEDAKRMMEYTKCRGVMIGRGALSAPWIFRDTWSYLTTGTIPPPLSIEAKCQLMRDHFNLHAEYRSERSAAMEFRKRVSWYAKEMNPCRSLRDGMRVIENRVDFENVMERFLEWRLRYDERGLEMAASRQRDAEPVEELVA
jgi:tRNA-dihydrouridine synthase